MARRYVDVNVFVYWLGGHPEYGERALEWVKRMETGASGSYVTASITVYETIVVLSRLTGAKLRDPSFIATIMDAFTGLRGLRVVETLYSDYISARDLMERYGLDFEDAIHLAVAERVGAQEIVSNDADFDKTPLRRVF